MTTIDRDAADAIMVTLMALCDQKRIAWESAEHALQAADGTVQKGRARFAYNVAHGEHMGAIEALYAARKVFNDHFGVVAIPAASR